MKKLLLLVFILAGCATLNVDPVCRHKALYAAVTLGERHPVRIVIGETNLDVMNHAQTQVFIENEWKWVSVVGDSVFVSKMDQFYPRRELSPDEFYNEIFKGKLHTK